MTKTSKLTLAAAMAVTLLTSPAFAQLSEGGKVTVLNPNSPALTGGGNAGYNETQQDPDRS